MANKIKKRKRKIKKMQQEQLVAERSSRRQIRHNTAANQEKHRPDWRPLQPDEFGVVAPRRIMPRDEQTRRGGLEAMSDASMAAEFDESLWTRMAADSPHDLGIVSEVSQGLCRVGTSCGVLICELRGILTAEGTGYTNIAAVGDRVLVRKLEQDRGLVEEVLPRRSGLARPDSYYTHLKRIIAANADQLLIIASWREPHLWRELIDDYLIGAQRNGLVPVICINKIDLAENVSECRAAVHAYADLGHRTVFTSAVTGEGLDELQGLLRGKTSVLSGLSGVGKSSLLTAIDPTLDLKVRAISQKYQEGKHTTTQANLYTLAVGGYVIDTPGIRDFGIKSLHKTDLIDFYPEIREVMGHCRFADCSHSHEPGCAVKTAVAEGTIAEWRYDNYCSIYDKLSA